MIYIASYFIQHALHKKIKYVNKVTSLYSESVHFIIAYHKIKKSTRIKGSKLKATRLVLQVEFCLSAIFISNIDKNNEMYYLDIYMKYFLKNSADE